MKHQKLPTDPEEFRVYVENLTNEFASELRGKDRAYDELTAKYEQEQTKSQQQYEELKEKYEILRRAFFGRKSEKLSAEESRQATLFNEAEETADEQKTEDSCEPEESITDDTSTPAKNPRRSVDCKRKPLPTFLPREEILIDVTDAQKQCGCGKLKHKIGEEISEELVIKPAELIVRRYKRVKYACDCEGSGDESQPAVITAPVPDKLIPKSIASSSLIAYIITGKYVDALPLYRQEKQFSRLGIELSRGSMSRWIISLGSRMSPLLDAYDQRIRSGPLIGMDETTIQVHREDGKHNSSTSYMWVARGGDPEHPLIHYMYHARRTGNIPAAYLDGYRGALQVDGYAGYLQAVAKNDLIHIGCLAHVRRKFYECSKLSNGSKASLAVLGKIKRIYTEEKKIQAQGLTDEQMILRRLEIVIPMITKLQRDLERKSLVVTPSSAFGKAVAYALVQIPKIKQYASIPCATLDNNATERAIRPFVIGRGNWHFADTPSGAHASAAWYSLIESAKASHLDPAAYITYVFDHLIEVEKSGQWELLLPENINLQ